MHFDTIVSYTTRPKREYETDGKEHFFIDEKTAQRLLTSQSIVAYTEIGEYKYFVTKQLLEDESKNLYVIDPKGIKYLLDNYSGLREYKIIYVYTDKLIRDTRAAQRPGYNEEVYKSRCEAEDEQFVEFEDSINTDARVLSYKGIEVILINNSTGTIEDILESLNQFIMETCVNNAMYLIVGRTCSGKDTLCNAIMNRFNREYEEE